ncbi:adhesion G-protein coupled receptor G6-like isoform X1 [Montipora capricornis]|uniref:adhesion G-protein coupled receptor G6-like isoform X1 n=2 Tax=Montipora capricornis TaxID=246305 RepID=UPI0035F1D4E7
MYRSVFHSMEPFYFGFRRTILALVGLFAGLCLGDNVSLHYHASGVVFNHSFTKEFYQKERKDCEPCKTLADDVEQGFWKMFDYFVKVKLFEKKKSILLHKTSKGVFFSPPSLGGQKINLKEAKGIDTQSQEEEMGVYFIMVIRLDLNVTDPAVNLHYLKRLIRGSCWSYLRQFQFYSTVYLNITTFNIEEIHESNVSDYLNYLSERHHFPSDVILRKVNDIPEDHQRALKAISYVGCALSSFGLILTVLTIAFSRKLRRLRPNQILSCMSLSLLAAILLFTFGINGVTGSDSVELCKALASLLHYFLLSSIVWMSIEAYNLYQDLVKVFDTTLTSQKEFMCRAGVLGWIIPAIIVVITILAEPDSYGFHMMDNNKQALCWMNANAFYGAFLAPVLLLMAFNVVTFLVVMKEIYNMPRMCEKSQRLSYFRATVSVFVLLGLNWLFAGLAAIVGTLVFHYLFTITCSFQGLFIFLLHGVIKTEFREAWRWFSSRNRMVEMFRSRSVVTVGKTLSLSSRNFSSVTPAPEHQISLRWTADKDSGIESRSK